MKPVVDQGLLVKCPDFIVWRMDEDLADWILKTEARYADCQARDAALVDRVIDMMNH